MTAIPLPLRRRHNAGRRRVALDDLGDAARWARATLRQWRRRRRERAELAAFDARALADIGLTRGEVEFLVNKPFWRE